MSNANAASGGVTLRPRPTTRSSIRHSLNLSSVGRAIADVMHKDTKEANAEKEKEKMMKKTKEVASRRSSAINIGPPSSLRGLDKAAKKEKVATPEPKTLSRTTKRLSAVKTGATSSDEPSSSPAASPKASPKTAAPRVSTLRPRNSVANSGLPKYRPKSLLAEPAKKPPSPARPGVRRKANSSDDETEEDSKGKRVLEVDSSKKALNRAVSPMPRRGALKVNLSAAINVTPTNDKKTKSSALRTSPEPQNGSTSRTSKTSRAAAAVSAIRSAIPRPPSSASSNSSRTPRTPHSVDTVVMSPGSSPAKSNRGGSPLRGSVVSPSGSPTRRLTTRRIVRGDSSGPSTPTPMLTEDDSTDSIEAQDVEFMLSSVASPTAPTPALPRLRNFAERSNDSHSTPSRSFFPSRAHLPHLSPVLASNENSPFQLPPPAERGSILSWDSLAAHSKNLGEDEFGNLLSEIPAPFRPGAISPSPYLTSTLNLPDSPSLSALPSPAEYGSISQVLLPDVTPSPAVHATAQLFDTDFPAADAATVTLLRLQLAAAENRAREQVMQVELLQSELLNAKQARMRDAEELAKQISQLEEQVVGNLRVDDQRSEYIGSLEDQLRHAQASAEHAAEEARAQAQRAATAREQQGKWELTCAAREAGSAWSAVRDTAEGELEFVRANREMLAVLLTGLDHSQRLLLCQNTC
ncbi:hypothetical protein OBBRIDRAFT_757851 [Obba rivulosa]|uniref:Uncharacterized protein n=1 Tax=Obba rivulosa TaxID=1052685 RepID=A0A8E2AZY0_9APHY|nr:hypothetical protein OBBRIDRAFT_757851 [Obba rivulosa]